MPRRRLASARAIGALILREMSSSYGRSPGAYVWAILEPVAGIALLSLVFVLTLQRIVQQGPSPTEEAH